MQGKYNYAEIESRSQSTRSVPKKALASQWHPDMKHILRLQLALAIVVTFTGADWLQFRGSQSTGVAPEADLPLNWSENVAWKSPLPGRGPSSPIVVGGRVFVTCSSGANQDKLHVVAFDAEGGHQEWVRQLWATGRTFTHPSSAVAANTPASDGERIFAFYSSNDLACFDLDGNLLWFRGLGHDYPKAGNDIGMSSSPVVVGDTVVVQVESQGYSFATGLNTLTGETRWHIERARTANWTSPVAMPGKDGSADVVLLQSPAGVTAHDAKTGNELPWKLEKGCAGIPSASVVDGVAYIPSEGITAIKADTASTQAEILWQEGRLQPGSASPIVHNGKVYALNRAGVLNCANAADGNLEWQLRLKGSFWASPVASGNHIFLVNADGIVQVVQLGEKGEAVAESELGEKIQGTPAIVGDAIFLRSDGHLWKIKKK
jgi:outer membrane protein assembly factor BamB